MSRVRFEDQEEDQNDQSSKLVEIDHFEEEQDRKEQRGIFKMKREIWIQDRKDRRAQMEIIMHAETDLTKTYEAMTNFKPKGLFQTSPVYLEERVKKIKLRIKNAEYQINRLTEKIILAEHDFL